ncbi:MAG: hypothetical protein RR523_13965 [Cetobacterium sp.]|uniref:hypothetical protein n=1 Tax=Cetobacterium sp. TaxID=2071632 RepID=UPI002FCA9D22
MLSKSEKEIISQLYAKGYNYSEIYNMDKGISCKKETLKKHIQRNLQDLKEEHLKNRQIKKDIRKALNETNLKFIGTKELIKWNRQSYITDEKGNLIFDETRGAIP